MFGSIRDFLYRHRRKFYITAGVTGALVLASKYAEHKLLEWHDKQTLSVIEKHKRRQHYEKTRQTANATALNLSSSITKIVTDELDTEQLIQALRCKPSNKLLLWEDLKIQGFSRCIATIYSSVLVGSLVHVKLMLLGGYSFGDSVQKQASGIKVSPEDQEKYLSHLQNFVEIGVPMLLNKIRKATAHSVKSLSLDKSLTLEQLEGILKNITLLLAGEISVGDGASNATDFKIQPWSRYVAEIKMTIPDQPNESLFDQMTNEMIDVIDSKDFNFVVQNLVQYGINHILDYIADFYPSSLLSKAGDGYIDNAKVSEITDGEKPNKSLYSSGLQSRAVEDCVDNGKVIEVKDDKKPNTTTTSSIHSNTVGSHSLLSEAVGGYGNNSKVNGEVKDEEQITTDTIPQDVPQVMLKPFMKSSLPVAKLVPILSDLVRPCLSPAPGHLLQFVLLNEDLENLCFNIYEAFSV